MKASGSKKLILQIGTRCQLALSIMGWGQGDVLVTPLQLANYTATIANKGWYYTPHIGKIYRRKT